MLEVLQNTIDIGIKAVNYGQNAVVSLFNVSESIGSLIVNCLLLIISYLSQLFSTVTTLIRILFEDLFVFTNDVGEKILNVINFISNCVEVTATSTKNVFISIKYCFVYVYEFIINSIHGTFSYIGKGFELFADIAELIKYGFILIGNGFWLAVQMIPLFIIYLASEIVESIIYLLVTTYDKITDIILTTTDILNSVFNWILQFLFDFPLESVGGLIIAAVLIVILHKYHRPIWRNCKKFMKRSYRFLRSACMCTYYSVLIGTNMWRRNARINQPLFADEFQDENDDDEQQQQNQELMIVRPIVRRSERLKHRISPTSTKPMTSEQLKRQLELEQAEKLCVVCKDQFKCIIVIPCRHLCMCQYCSTIIENTTCICPMCRQHFERTMSVYL